MSILSDFEDRIGRALEHGFASVFRAPVQPAELARKLGKEMDHGKKLGVGKVYAPTLYSILLSRQDDTALGGFADTLAGELETYLMGYARERHYELATRPVVRFLVDKQLKLGRFEIIGELLSPEELVAEIGYLPDEEQYETPREPSYMSAGSPLSGAPLAAPPVRVEPTPVAPELARPEPVSAPSVFDADELDLDFVPSALGGAATGAGVAGAAGLAAGAAANAAAGAAASAAAGASVASAPAAQPPLAANPTELIAPSAPAAPPLATVTVRGVDHDVVLRGDRMVVGRLQTCEICLTDVNVSREHAAFEREGLGWAVHDLGSTNGTLVNGERIVRERLRDRDVVTIGITELVYHEPRS